MSELSGHNHSHGSKGIRLDKAVIAILTILLVTAIAAPDTLKTTVVFAVENLWNTLPFIVFAVLSVAWLKATGAESLVAKSFAGREVRMIVLASLMGGLSPFCSCEVIPFIAALLAVGAPLSAVMAFWIASPLMDPAMFLITASALGVPFAAAKTAFAIGMAMMGGFIVMAFSRSPLFADPLRENGVTSGCGCGPTPFSGKPQWRFWQEAERRESFKQVTVENAFFLMKWLALAYLIEGIMLEHIPAEMVAEVLGGDGVGVILLAALVGAPAYLNGYAAVPLVQGLLQQGMSDGAAMAFVIAGGVSCIPAALAVWALVKPRVFAAYISISFAGAVLAGIIWAAAN